MTHSSDEQHAYDETSLHDTRASHDASHGPTAGAEAYASMPGGPVAFGDTTGGSSGRRGKHPVMPEEHVMRIWEEEAGSGRGFRLRDGRSCMVIRLGEVNRADGPDYLDAQLCIDGVGQTGDIELHLRPEQWLQHGHDRDPGYENVILHVCMYPPRRTVGGPPLLILAGQLLRPLRSRWSDILSARGSLTRHCSGLLGGVPASTVETMLMLAASERFERKCRVMDERFTALSRQNIPGSARQLLFEYTARALGYGGNQDGLQRLAEALPLRRLAAVEGEARLVLLRRGAGLLPADSGKPRSAAAVAVLASHVWKHTSVTPANRVDPALRRLVATVSCYADPQWWEALRSACRPAAVLDTSTVLRLFRFLGRGSPSRSAGIDRAREIVVNAFSPWCKLCGEQEGLSAAIAARLYHELPDAASNHLTRSFELELGTTVALSSGVQQGMIELGSRYCERRLCHACLIGNALEQQ